MKVFGFVGPSGTGKSHRATWVAREREIEFIIDDGLLIRGNRIVAGSSAKKEKTKIASVKWALFIDDNHANDIKRALELYEAKSLLILGTSDGMVEKIAKKIGVPEISEKINIEDVASKYEIQQALTSRREQGKHVIPVPTFEIRKDFSGYFLDPLQIFRRKGMGRFQLEGEKSVVRPTFSYMGKYTISDYTIYQISEYVTMSVKGVSKITRFRAENYPDGLYIEMDLTLVYGYELKSLMKTIQNKVSEEIQRLTALNIRGINLIAKNLIVEEKPQV